jgi:hypothetical protein
MRSSLRFLIGVLCLAALTPNGASLAQSTTKPETWTAIIFDAFQGNVYTWRLKPGGKYEEDGRDARAGFSIQATLTGKWTRKDNHLVLKQDYSTYVFDGIMSGDRYSGTFYSGDRAVSKFCAWRGTTTPTSCTNDLVS